MAKKPPPTSVSQTATGNDNIQVVGNNNVITRITNFFAGDAEQQRAMRNRRAMLELVKNTWIKGVLEKSLYNEVLIKPGLEECPSAIDHPWDMQMQMSNQANRTLPAGYSMMDVFEEMNGAMLILGEPGSGKTTALLELARDCIARAEQDDTHRIPVVFNLSSWFDPKQSLDEWLVGELNTKYYISKKIAQTWVANADLLLLLDGLDEVRQEIREACIKGINDFRQKHEMPIAVCSRVADYEVLTTKLHLSGAVLLQPLTTEQIDAYFQEAGPKLEGAHQALKNDLVLKELVKQPLILSIFTLTYQGKGVETIAIENSDTQGIIFSSQNFELGQKNNYKISITDGVFGYISLPNEGPDAIKTRRKYLFDTYIQQMFGRVARTKNNLYTTKQTKQWMGWLASTMLKQRQSIFHIELMQPTYLPTLFQQGIVTSGPAIVIGTIAGLIVWSMIQVKTGWDIGPLAGLIVGLLFGSFIFSNEIHPVEALSWSWDRIIAPLKIIASPFLKNKKLLFFLLICGVILGLTAVLIGGGLSGGLIGFFVGAFSMPIFLLLSFLFNMLMFGPFYGLVKKEVVTRSVPNEGIRRSFRSALLSGIIFGSYLGVIFGLIGFTLGGLSWMVGGGLFGISVGVCGGFWYGGVACLQHFILRILLHRNKTAPWNYVQFLDYCTERIFLRRVGGGYIFVHRLLMEHFAAMYKEE